MPRAKIQQIQSGMRNDVATATLEDETGTIHVNLWRQQIDIVSEGKVVKLINAFARLYGNRFELSIGKGGQILSIEEG